MQKWQQFLENVPVVLIIEIRRMHQITKSRKLKMIEARVQIYRERVISTSWKNEKKWKLKIWKNVFRISTKKHKKIKIVTLS